MQVLFYSFACSSSFTKNLILHSAAGVLGAHVQHQLAR